MIILMGVQGSGKGTQGQMLADSYGYHLISMGELVRLYVTGERRKQMMEGVLLEDNEIIEILSRVLANIRDDEECILDGFPRTIPQAEWLFEQVKVGLYKLTAVIDLIASHEVVMKRLMSRGRIDDTEEAIDKRLQEYNRATKPLIDWYQTQGIEVLNINAERPPHEVHKDIVKSLGLE